MRINPWLSNCEKRDDILPQYSTQSNKTQEFVIRKSTGTERKMLINTNFL